MLLFRKTAFCANGGKEESQNNKKQLFVIVSLCETHWGFKRSKCKWKHSQKCSAPFS